MDSFIRKGFYTIGALKTNRILYPWGIRQKASLFALHLRKTDPGVSLVTVGGRQFYVYRYEGELNGIPNAAVIISYPKDAFGNPKALRLISLYGCQSVNSGDTGDLYQTVADRIIFPSKQK